MSTSVLTMLVWLAATVVPQGQNVVLRGQVVDGEGKPVEGAAVSWVWLNGKPLGNVITDADGRFEVKSTNYGNPLAVLAISSERSHGAIALYDPESLDRTETLKLRKLVRLRGKFSCSELGVVPPSTEVVATIQPEGVVIAASSSEEAEFSLLLPPGTYMLDMHGADVRGKIVERTILGDEGVIDFETVDLAASRLSQMYGKEPPRWSVTDARGVPKTVQLSDYKGKYVLVEFWGFW